MVDTWTVMVRFNDRPRAERLTPDGYTTTRRVHAAMIRDKARAESAAAEIMRDHPEFVTRAWVQAF